MKINTSLNISPELEETLLEFAGIHRGFNPGQKAFKKVAEDIKTVSNNYTIRQGYDNVFSNRDLLKAYCLYFLPVNLVKLFPLLDEVVLHKPIDIFNNNSVSVLDIGSGPGTFGLSFLEYIIRNRQGFKNFPQNVRITFVDKVGENLKTASNLVDAYIKKSGAGGKLKVQILCRRGEIETLNAGSFGNARGGYDIIIAGNVLSETADGVSESFCSMIEEYLSDNGVFFAIEPGTKTGSGKLLKLKNLISEKTGLNLYAPCLNHGTCPLSENPKQWCHVKIFWEPPFFVSAADRLTRFTKEKGIKFSYHTFIKKRAVFAEMYPQNEREKLYRVVSYLIKNKGEKRLFVCNGNSRFLLRRLDRNESETNSDFNRVQRGDIVFIDNFKQYNDFHSIEKASEFKLL